MAKKDVTLAEHSIGRYLAIILSYASVAIGYTGKRPAGAAPRKPA
jgi:hypothetical protein